MPGAGLGDHRRCSLQVPLLIPTAALRLLIVRLYRHQDGLTARSEACTRTPEVLQSLSCALHFQICCSVLQPPSATSVFASMINSLGRGLRGGAHDCQHRRIRVLYSGLGHADSGGHAGRQRAGRKATTGPACTDSPARFIPSRGRPDGSLRRSAVYICAAA